MNKMFKELTGDRVLLAIPKIETSIELTEAAKAELEREAFNLFTRLKVEAVGTDVVNGNIDIGAEVYVPANYINASPMVRIEDKAYVICEVRNIFIIW